MIDAATNTKLVSSLPPPAPLHLASPSSDTTTSAASVSPNAILTLPMSLLPPLPPLPSDTMRVLLPTGSRVESMEFQLRLVIRDSSTNKVRSFFTHQSTRLDPQSNQLVLTQAPTHKEYAGDAAPKVNEINREKEIKSPINNEERKENPDTMSLIADNNDATLISKEKKVNPSQPPNSKEERKGTPLTTILLVDSNAPESSQSNRKKSSSSPFIRPPKVPPHVSSPFLRSTVSRHRQQSISHGSPRIMAGRILMTTPQAKSPLLQMPAGPTLRSHLTTHPQRAANTPAPATLSSSTELPCTSSSSSSKTALVNVNQPKKRKSGEIITTAALSDDMWPLHRIIDHRISPRGRDEYLVHWCDRQGRPFPRRDATGWTWEPRENLAGCEKEINEYHEHVAQNKKKKRKVVHTSSKAHINNRED